MSYDPLRPVYALGTSPKGGGKGRRTDGASLAPPLGELARRSRD